MSRQLCFQPLPKGQHRLCGWLSHHWSTSSPHVLLRHVLVAAADATRPQRTSLVERHGEIDSVPLAEAVLVPTLAAVLVADAPCLPVFASWAARTCHLHSTRAHIESSHVTCPNEQCVPWDRWQGVSDAVSNPPHCCILLRSLLCSDAHHHLAWQTENGQWFPAAAAVHCRQQ